MLNWIDDFFLPYVTFAAFTFNSWVCDFVADHFGDYAGYIVIVILLPVSIVLLLSGVIISFIAMAVAFILSPIILPFTIYRHLRK